jgi:hypothetical protein
MLTPPTAPFPTFYSDAAVFPIIDLVGELLDFVADGAIFFTVAGLF